MKTEAIVDGLPINALHRAIAKWEQCIGSNGKNFNGKRCPNLADLVSEFIKMKIKI